ncbi:glycosyltransferase family 87 protein [Bradyrhizobium sp. CCBAU 45389]|uniref:glycosyltransferase family 87 protein n=1 Tax=Bradyrhizobium sp. CCBAU 45389 TaxID=858429 RepID=UPI0023061753|nr:glycosyltransferase family 87 protein [Bradyrhizobium sp. CCBAU 45389]MDA9397720.1 hypothetical protein [Bradyrhizobium sp. CCBAU 45389]
MGARFILYGLAIVLVLMTASLSDWQAGQFRHLLDFDAFYIVAQRVWLGDVAQVYYFDQFAKLQIDTIGRDINIFGYWTYPPQFTLLVAPLALLPVGASYFLFVAGTLGCYLLTLRAISRSCFALVVILLAPVLLLTLFGGQNGFLTGSLIGVTCLAMERKQIAAGLSLGMMVIKPHLAVAIGIYALLARRWIAVMTAMTVILLSSILCTLLFGVSIWSAFLTSAHESAVFLGSGRFDVFRSISLYAIMRTVGFSASWAFLGQAAVAVVALSVVAFAIYRDFPARWSLGISAVATLLISPYAYDYDLPILGVGMALLLPDLTRLATGGERAAIYGLTFMSGFYGLFQILRLTIQDGKSIEQPAFDGLLLVTLLWLIVRVLLRGADEARRNPRNGADVDT